MLVSPQSLQKKIWQDSDVFLSWLSSWLCQFQEVKQLVISCNSHLYLLYRICRNQHCLLCQHYRSSHCQPRQNLNCHCLSLLYLHSLACQPCLLSLRSHCLHCQPCLQSPSSPHLLETRPCHLFVPGLVQLLQHCWFPSFYSYDCQFPLINGSINCLLVLNQVPFEV